MKLLECLTQHADGALNSCYIS